MRSLAPRTFLIGLFLVITALMIMGNFAGVFRAQNGTQDQTVLGTSNGPAPAAPAPSGGSTGHPPSQCGVQCQDQGCGCNCTADCNGPGSDPANGICCPSGCSPVICSSEPGASTPPPPPPPASSAASSIPSMSSSASSTVGGAPPPPPPPPPPASSSTGSSGSSASSSSNSGGPPPPPPPPPASSGGSSSAITSCRGGTTCNNVCPSGMPRDWHFTVSNVTNGICLTGECDVLNGTFDVFVYKEGDGNTTYNCGGMADLRSEVCPSQINGVKDWTLIVVPPTDDGLGTYTAQLVTAAGFAEFRHYGAWNCNGPNRFTQFRTPGANLCRFTNPDFVLEPGASTPCNDCDQSRCKLCGNDGLQVICDQNRCEGGAYGACKFDSRSGRCNPDPLACSSSSSSSPPTSSASSSASSASSRSRPSQPPLQCSKTTCAGLCPGGMPTDWQFSVDGLTGVFIPPNTKCSDGECKATEGTYTMSLAKEIPGVGCEFDAIFAKPLCESSGFRNLDGWRMRVFLPGMASNNAEIGYSGAFPMFVTKDKFTCAGPNQFVRYFGDPSSGLEGKVCDVRQASDPLVSPVICSSSSSSAASTPCDSLICALGGLTDCNVRGFTTCTPDPLNPPYCHSCSGVPNPLSSSSSTAFRLSSSSSMRSSAASSQSLASSSSPTTTASSSSIPKTAASSSSTPIAPAPRCGDSLINRSAESCDDGPNNGDPASPCASSCLLASGQRCTLNNQCDSGRCIQGRCLASCESDTDCPDPLHCVKGLCKLPECGDGVVSPGETCDLGKTCTSDPASCNRAPGTSGVACLCDPADTSCPRKPGVVWARGCVPPPGDCGNGVLDTNTEVLLNGKSVNGSLHREECDLGMENGKPNSPCSSTCMLVIAPFCGNNRIDPGEKCDSGVLNGTPASTCPSDCGVAEDNPPEAGGSFKPPIITGHAAPTVPSAYDLPLLPVTLPATTSANLTRLSISRAPVAKTGPEALLAIAMGAGFGWSMMRRRK